MAANADPRKRVREAFQLAQGATLCMGLGLLVWGVAPAAVQRIASRTAVDFQTLGVCSVTLLLGMTFVGLFVLIRGRIEWAMRAALWTGVFLLAGSVLMSLLGGGGTLSLFPALLAGATVFTNWLAITALNAARAESPGPGSTPSA